MLLQICIFVATALILVYITFKVIVVNQGLPVRHVRMDLMILYFWKYSLSLFVSLCLYLSFATWSLTLWTFRCFCSLDKRSYYALTSYCVDKRSYYALTSYCVDKRSYYALTSYCSLYLFVVCLFWGKSDTVCPISRVVTTNLSCIVAAELLKTQLFH